MQPMKKYIASVVVLVFLSCVGELFAHITSGGFVEATATVRRIRRQNDDFIQARAEISMYTGPHEVPHSHLGEYYLHTYVTPAGTDPGNTPHSLFLYRSASNVSPNAQGRIVDDLEAERSLLGGCWDGLAKATGSLHTEGHNDHIRDTDHDWNTLCPIVANDSANTATPPNMGDIKAELQDAIDLGPTHTNAALFLNGHILTLDFDPNNTVYECRDNGVVLTLGNGDLVESHVADRTLGGNVVQLDLAGGEPSMAAPPRPRPLKKVVTTLWGSIKQR